MAVQSASLLFYVSESQVHLAQRGQAWVRGPQLGKRLAHPMYGVCCCVSADWLPVGCQVIVMPASSECVQGQH
jgi:hypothetical protein